MQFGESAANAGARPRALQYDEARCADTPTNTTFPRKGTGPQTATPAAMTRYSSPAPLVSLAAPKGRIASPSAPVQTLLRRALIGADA